jgi:hypothetical protein
MDRIAMCAGLRAEVADQVPVAKVGLLEKADLPRITVAARLKPLTQIISLRPLESPISSCPVPCFAPPTVWIGSPPSVVNYLTPRTGTWASSVAHISSGTGNNGLTFISTFSNPMPNGFGYVSPTTNMTVLNYEIEGQWLEPPEH